MINKRGHRRKHARLVLCLLCGLAALGLLSGCLEQYQSTRAPEGSLANFLLHLHNGELDDARTYFAPGLVTPSAELDNSLKTAAERLQRYEFRNIKYTSTDLPGGESQVTGRGDIRAVAAAGTPTPAPDSGWQQGDIITARMVMRGPGYRILSFEVKCCP